MKKYTLIAIAAALLLVLAGCDNALHNLGAAPPEGVDAEFDGIKIYVAEDTGYTSTWWATPNYDNAEAGNEPDPDVDWPGDAEKFRDSEQADGWKVFEIEAEDLVDDSLDIIFNDGEPGSGDGGTVDDQTDDLEVRELGVFWYNEAEGEIQDL